MINYLSIKNLLYEIKADFTEQDRVHFRNMDSYIPISSKDYIETLVTTAHDYLVVKVAILPVTNYRAKIPADFRKFVMVAGSWAKRYNKRDRLGYKTEILAEIRRSSDGCVSILQKHCQCPESSCECAIDLTWHQIETGFDGVGTTLGPGGLYNLIRKYSSDYEVDGSGRCRPALNREFTILSPSKNNLHALRTSSVDGCINFSIAHAEDIDQEYRVEPGTIVTGFKEGMILLTYKGVLKDEFGIPMFPDIPQVTSAIKAYCKWKISEYLLKMNRDFNVYYVMEKKANQEFLNAHGPAIAKMREIPWDRLVSAILNAKYAGEIRTSFGNLVGRGSLIDGRPNKINDLTGKN